jgi:hypothetical protein
MTFIFILLSVSIEPPLVTTVDPEKVKQLEIAIQLSDRERNEDESPEHQAALEYMTKFIRKKKNSSPTLIALLSKPKLSTYLRSKSLTLLHFMGKLDPEIVIPVLIPLLKDESPQIRMQAMQLWNYFDSEDLVYISHMLFDPSSAVRDDVYRKYAWYGGITEYRQLKRLLNLPSHQSGQQMIRWAMREITMREELKHRQAKLLIYHLRLTRLAWAWAIR